MLRKILERFKMTGCKPELAATEIESEHDMVTDKGPPVENQIVRPM
jgi:hypothetical protein